MSYVHLYTGNGKGKTTAAIGMAIRSAGAGNAVFIAQFVKGMHYSELDVLNAIPNICIRQYGLDCFIRELPAEKDIKAAQHGFEEVKKALNSEEYKLLILDEICIAIHYKLIDQSELLDALKNRPDHTEIVLTGRYAEEELIEFADLVTEMKEIKHYYTKGVEARKGVEF